MRLIFNLLCCLLISPYRIQAYKSEITETCYLLSSLLFPSKDLTPDYPKNDICRYRESPHCCTQSVEAVLRGRAQSDSHQLFFRNLITIRDITHRHFSTIQTLNLPFLSDSLRQTALQYRVIENLSIERSALVKQATLQFMDSFLDVDYMPNFCSEKIVADMGNSINRYLQELVYSYKLLEVSWQAADDIFSTISSSEFSPSCVNDLIRAGMTELSCKSCTDHTLKIPTCFNYCTDVVSKCLVPFQPLIDILILWFPQYVKVQENVHTYTHYNRYRELKLEMESYIRREMMDDFYSDVCEYHFKAVLSDTSRDYSVNDPERRKRIVKALPKPDVYSTEYITLHPTPETPSTYFDPAIAERKLFNPNLICYNHTRTVVETNCWNGEGRGVYITDMIPTTEETPKDISKEHLPRLKSKLNNLMKNLQNKLVIIELDDFSNNADAGSTKGTSSSGFQLHFKTVMILTFLLIWIKPII